MAHFILCPLVVAVGIFGFLVATQAVSLTAVAAAALVVLLGATAHIRKTRQQS